jgi:signal peptidase I
MAELNFNPDRTRVTPETEKPRFTTGWRKIVMVILASLFGVIAAGFTGLGVAVRFLGLRAFRVPTGSMCPTVCANERLLASMDAYKGGPPERGDVIMLGHQGIQGLLIKRVVGVGSDIVSSGPRNAVVVNGKAIERPKLCGKPDTSEVTGESPSFAAVTVREGSLFVIGDNLGNSYDSRIPGFGLVKQEDVKGKPLILYWSPAASRIGCSIR